EASAAKQELPRPELLSLAIERGARRADGRPIANTQQLSVDYTIRARLPPESALVSGYELVRIRKTSSDTLHTLWLRLDHNLFRPGAPRDAEIAEETEGMVIIRIAIDGLAGRIGNMSSAADAAFGGPVLSGSS